MGDVIILDDPQDSPASKVDKLSIRRIRERHGIPFEDVLAPSRHQRVHLSLVKYTACNWYMYMPCCVPPFNHFIRKLLQFMKLAQTQLHPNSYLSKQYVHNFRLPSES